MTKKKTQSRQRNDCWVLFWANSRSDYELSQVYTTEAGLRRRAVRAGRYGFKVRAVRLICDRSGRIRMKAVKL